MTVSDSPKTGAASSGVSSSASPVFAVVGRANKGKSSIIATLAEDDRIEISPIPGTTRRCEAFPVTLDGRTLFTLVDTPGFEQAPAVLHWLEQTKPPSDRRRERVREFVATFEGTQDFVEERELLGPILDGAAILYVGFFDAFSETELVQMSVLWLVPLTFGIFGKLAVQAGSRRPRIRVQQIVDNGGDSVRRYVGVARVHRTPAASPSDYVTADRAGMPDTNSAKKRPPAMPA